ncbi:MAG: hypothetical protein J2P17_07940, partial [Mycobacterium sp.]|nr:hypothetical protein [Mycobacterium sp.]
MGPLLNIGGYILKDIMSWVVQLIPSFQQWLGIISTNMPEFNQLFNLLMQMGTQALVGLVNNGLKLVDWVSKLVGNTTGMTIVNQTFGLMGNIVQYVAGVVGNMVGWFINNWPTITSLVQEVTGAFVALSPQITWAAGQFQAIWNQFSQNQQFKDGIQAIANVCAGALVVGINLAVGAFQTMATTITLVGAAVDGIGWYFNQLGTDIQNGLASAEDIIDSFISGFNSAFGGMGLEITMPTWGHTYQLGAAQTRTGVYAANSGGLVPGGGPNRDSTLMYLTPGEYVIDRNTTQALGLGAGPSNIAGLIGAIGGQCLAWVSQMTGLYRGVPMAADLIPDINSEIPKIGELAVFSGAAVGNTAGHVGFVEGLNPLTLLDSNWSNDGVIREHTIPANLPTGYIDIGASTLPGLNLPNLLSGLLGQFHGTGFFGGVVNNLLGKIGNAAIGTFDNGGTLLPGALAYNASSRPEMVRSAAQEDELGAKLDRIAELLTGGVGGPTVNVHGAAPTPQEIIGAMTWAQYSRA